MANNNVAILSIMSKFDEKSAREAAKRADKVYEEALNDIGNVNFDKELIEKFDKAMDHIKSKSLKKVNLSSYTISILDSIMSDKDIAEKSKAIEEFVHKIEMLKKASVGQNENAFNMFSTAQLEAVIKKAEKLEQKQAEIAVQTKKFESEANKAASKTRKVSTIDNNYGNQDYSKVLESLTKSLGIEKEFIAEQKESIDNLAKMLNLYQTMEKSKPEEGTKEAIRYSKDLLTVTQQIIEAKEKVDSFTSKGASTYISNNDKLSNVDKVSEYTIGKSKTDYVKTSLSKLKSEEAKIQSEIFSYIKDTASAKLEKTTAEANKAVEQAGKKVDTFNQKIEDLKSVSGKGTSGDKPIIKNIVDESELKTLEEIEQRLYDISDKDADGKANNKEFKEYIALYKQYETLIQQDSKAIFDDSLREEYELIVSSSKALKKYSEELDKVSAQKKETSIDTASSTADASEKHIEQLKEEQTQIQATSNAEEELNQTRKETENTRISVDTTDAISQIDILQEKLDNLPIEKNIKINITDNDYSDTPLLSDEEGKVVTVFRGVAGAWSGLINNDGIAFFTDKLKLAADYADSLAESGKVFQANLSFKNPLEIDGNGSKWNEIDFNGVIKTTDEIVEMARQLGYDGVIFKNILDGFADTDEDLSNVMVALNQAQIKNAEVVAAVKAGTGEMTSLSQNNDLNASVDESKSKLELEAELMESIAKNARDAAEAKKEFVEANAEVKVSTDASNVGLEEEKKNLEEIANVDVDKTNLSSENKESILSNNNLINSENKVMDSSNKLTESIKEQRSELNLLSYEAGQVITAYRGVHNVISGLVSSGRFAGGTFSSDDPRVAKMYAGETGKAYSHNIAVKNPLEIQGRGKDWNNLSYLGTGKTEESKNAKQLLSDYKSVKSELQDIEYYGEEYNGQLAETEKKLTDILNKVYELNKSDSLYGLSLSKEGNDYRVTTNDFVRKATANGFDSVIFKDIVDTWGGEKIASNVFALLDENQLQNVKTLNSNILDSLTGFFNQYPSYAKYVAATKEGLVQTLQYIRDLEENSYSLSENEIDKEYEYCFNKYPQLKDYFDSQKYYAKSFGSGYDEDGYEDWDYSKQAEDVINFVQKANTEFQKVSIAAQDTGNIIKQSLSPSFDESSYSNLQRILSDIGNINSESQTDNNSLYYLMENLKDFNGKQLTNLGFKDKENEANSLLSVIHNIIYEIEELQEEASHCFGSDEAEERQAGLLQDIDGLYIDLRNNLQQFYSEAEKGVQNNIGYVDKLKVALKEFGLNHDSNGRIEYMDDYRRILESFPEIEQLNNISSLNDVNNFINSSSWYSWLETLPQAQEYLQSIGYYEQEVINNQNPIEDVFQGDTSSTGAEQAIQQQNELQEKLSKTQSQAEQTGQVLDETLSTVDTANISRSFSDEIESISKVQDAVNKLTTAIGTTKIEAINNEVEAMKNAANDEIESIDIVILEVEKLIEVLQKKNELIEKSSTPTTENSKVQDENATKSNLDVESFRQSTKTLTQLLETLKAQENDSITSPIITIAEQLKNINALENVSNIMSSIKIKQNEISGLSSLAGYLTNINTVLKEIEASYASGSFIQDITNLTSQVDGLRRLAEVLKQSKNKIKAVSNATESDVSTEELKKEKKLYTELTDTIREYKTVGTRINRNQALDGDINDAEKLKQKIEQLQKEPILSTEHLENSQRQLANVEKALNTVKRQTEASNAQYVANAISSVQLLYDKLNKEPQTDILTSKLSEMKNQLDIMKKYDGINIISDAELKEVQNAENKVKQLKIEISKLSTNEAGAKQQTVEKLIRNITQYLDANTKMSKKARIELKAYVEELQTLGINAELDKIGSGWIKIANNERLANREGKSLISIFKDKAIYNNISSIVSMFFSWYQVINVIREAISTVTELDTALTEMRKVSTESVSSLKKYQDQTFNTANTVGTTALDLQEATASWMRLGESLSDAAESAKDTTILLNVSEFESIDDATESLVAMSQAYTELSKMDIINKLNQVGNNYSISTDEAASALQKSASALKTANNNMDEALALVTAGELSIAWIYRNICRRIYLTAGTSLELYTTI